MIHSSNGTCSRCNREAQLTSLGLCIVCDDYDSEAVIHRGPLPEMTATQREILALIARAESLTPPELSSHLAIVGRERTPSTIHTALKELEELDAVGFDDGWHLTMDGARALGAHIRWLEDCFSELDSEVSL